MANVGHVTELRWRLYHRKTKRICFAEDLSFDYFDGKEKVVVKMSGVRLTPSGCILTEGNGCPQVDIQYNYALCAQVLKQKEWKDEN